MNRRLPVFLLALAVTGLALGEEVDPPGRVARLSTIQGNVSFQSEDSSTPEQAEINLPVTSGDRVLTESESRAELSLGTAAIRLDERSDLSVSNLDEDIAQIELNSGAVSVHLRELGNGETFEIDTPNATIRLMQPGDYRVDVESDGASVLAVRNGDAQIDSGTGPVHVHDQQQARLFAHDRYADVTVLGTPDAFDDWSMDRERQLQDSQAERYVSREVVGYEDLDHYGTWYDDAEYGEVWAPSVVSVGWAPYTYGRWVWVGAWGWTWVDRSPWGFAPFHYGRWAYSHQRWCWVPGPRHRRPVYAPALVAWSDRHDDFAYSRNRRPSGWIPLGPREVYVPHRNVSPRYLRNVNIGNAHIDDNTRITNEYRNRRNGYDGNYVNRNAPGVRPPNNGVPLPRSGLAGNGSLQNGPNERWENGRGQSERDHAGQGQPPNGSVSVGDGRDNDRWRNGPGWRTGPSQGRLVTGRDDRRDDQGSRDDSDRGRWNSGDRNGAGDRNGSGDRSNNGSNWADNPSTGRGAIVGDGRMTIPRSPDNRSSQGYNETQRERMAREVAEATHGYDRRLSSSDRSAQDRAAWQQRQNEQADAQRRNSRSWNRGGSEDRGSVRSYGGAPRSYGGATLGNGNPSVSQPRPAPSPRMEQRQPQPQPRMEQRPSQPSQPSRSQPSGNRGGDSFRGGGRLGNRQ